MANAEPPGTSDTAPRGLRCTAAFGNTFLDPVRLLSSFRSQEHQEYGLVAASLGIAKTPVPERIQGYRFRGALYTFQCVTGSPHGYGVYIYSPHPVTAATSVQGDNNGRSASRDHTFLHAQRAPPAAIRLDAAKFRSTYPVPSRQSGLAESCRLQVMGRACSLWAVDTGCDKPRNWSMHV
ncbi:hypothetical protein OH77DRAFT_243862 [Trametes cingulata]|nr:hypothetical protein OH77DRAFT_243862 [Trametes cingulata]